MKGQREAVMVAERKAADEQRKAREESARENDKFAREQAAATQQMIGNFREGGEGALRMARGIAFLSASGSQDMQKLAQSVAIAQGAFDVFAGGFKAVTNLARVFGGPVATAVTVVAAAATAGAVAWNRWKASAEEAAKAADEARKAAMELEGQLADNWRKQQEREGAVRSGQSDIARLRQEMAITPEQRAAALVQEERELEQERKTIETDRRRRLRGFQGGQFRGGEAEAWQELLKFGSASHLENARDIEERRMAVARRQLDIDKEQQRIQRERLSEQQSLEFSFYHLGAQAAGGGSVASAAAFAPGVSQIAAQNTQQMRELIAAQTAANNALIEAYRDAQQKITDLRNALAAANPE
jgi:hypothetical protein